MGEQLKINKYLSFGITTHYREWNQYIIGFTINKEKVESSDDYDNAPHKIQNKYEFNLWLIFIGLHMSIRGKSKQLKTK
jgi:hypothetical protein